MGVWEHHPLSWVQMWGWDTVTNSGFQQFTADILSSVRQHVLLLTRPGTQTCFDGWDFQGHDQRRLEMCCESESCSVVSNSLQPHGLYSPWNYPGQNTGVDSLSLHQGVFPNQRVNSGLLHCRQILYQLSHQGSPRILECIAYPFSSGSSQRRNWTRISCIAGGFFTNWATREVS